jgi:hypothetical protein
VTCPLPFLIVPYLIEGYGAPAAIRTRDLRLRRPTLYPAELQARELGLAIVLVVGKRRPDLMRSALHLPPPAV